MGGVPTPSNDLHGLRVLHVASDRFEAARVLASVAHDNKFARLHGHGFIVSAYAALPADWAFYPGGELPRLTETLHRQAQRFHYRSLNDLLAEPSDLNLATWFGRELDVAGVTDIVVQSTPDQGVSVNRSDGSQADGMAVDLKAVTTEFGAVIDSRPHTSCPTCPRGISADACMATVFKSCCVPPSTRCHPAWQWTTTR